MGYISTFSFLNDATNYYEKDQELGRKISSAIRKMPAITARRALDRSVTISSGNYCNPIVLIGQNHANQNAIFVQHSGFVKQSTNRTDERTEDLEIEIKIIEQHLHSLKNELKRRNKS